MGDGSGGDAQIWLGDIGRPLPEEEQLDLHLSRLGGDPVWLRAPEEQQAPTCSRCGRHFGFLGQLNGGYDASHCRVLYLFACLTPSCGSDDRSWCVLRDLSTLPRQRSTVSSAALPSAAAASTLGRRPALAASAEWGVDAGVDDEIEALLRARDSRSATGPAAGGTAGRASEVANATAGAGAEGGSAAAEGAAGEGEVGEEAEPLAMLRGKKSLRTRPASAPEEGPSAAEAPSFPAFALEIYEEPAALPKSGEKELELLARYWQSELAAEDASAEAVAHAVNHELPAVDDEDVVGDTWFLKLQRRLERSPAQVVRYSWGGKPLWISEPPEESNNSAWPPPCRRCGGPRRFELQLMPTLLYEVRRRCPEQVGDSEIEWGTVLVYTCSRDCSGEPGPLPSLCQEFVVVQPAV